MSATQVSISALTAATLPLSATDLFIVSQGGAAKQATVAELLTGASAGTTFTVGSSLANQIIIGGSGTGLGVTATAAGSDTNVDVRAVPKGSGAFEVLRGRFGTANGGAALFDGTTPLTVANNPAFTGTVNPTLYVHGTYQGTSTSGGPFNTFAADYDTVNAASIGGTELLHIGHSYGGAGTTGGRTALKTFLQSAANTSDAPGNYNFYVAMGAFSYLLHNVGGTSGSPSGSAFGGNVSAVVGGTNTYALGVCGFEVDVGIRNGSGGLSPFKSGITVVQWVDDFYQGVVTDAAYGVANQPSGTAPGWKIGFSFGLNVGWWPFTSTSTLIGAQAGSVGGGPAMHAAIGWDASLITFGTAFLKSTGFLVDGSGNVTANTFLSNTNNAIILTGQTSGPGSGAGTLTNAPAAGNPAFWVPLTINGTARHVPVW